MQPQHGMGNPGRALQNTTAPPYAPTNNYHPVLVSGFSTGLCDCFSDTSLCCLTCCCPCITFGRIAEIVDKGSSSCGVSGALYSVLMCFTRFQWIYSCTYRTKMKAQFGIPEDNIADCCTHFCCEPCALCQEYRELQYRGYDVALGWQGNMERANQEMVRPSVPGGMVR